MFFFVFNGSERHHTFASWEHFRAQCLKPVGYKNSATTLALEGVWWLSRAFFGRFNPLGATQGKLVNNFEVVFTVLFFWRTTIKSWILLTPLIHKTFMHE